MSEIPWANAPWEHPDWYDIHDTTWTAGPCHHAALLHVRAERRLRGEQAATPGPQPDELSSPETVRYHRQ